MMSPVFYVAAGAVSVEALRLIVGKIVVLIRKKRNQKRRAANREQWMKELFYECNRPIGQVCSIANITTSSPVKKG